MSEAGKSTNGTGSRTVRTSDTTFHMVGESSLAPDLLKGVRDITMYLYGTADKSAVRSVYHICATSTLPTFKLGSITCALKSSIRAKIWAEQKRGFAKGQEDLVRLHILLNSILKLAAIRKNGASDPIQPLLAEATETIQRLLQVDAP